MIAWPNKLYGDYQWSRGQPNSIWKRKLTCGKQASGIAGGRLIDRVVILRPIQHKIRSFRRRSSSHLIWKKISLTQQKHTIINQKKFTTTQNTHKKLQPGLVVSYDIWPGNGEGLL